MLALRQSEAVRDPLDYALEVIPWPALLIDASTDVHASNAAAAALLESQTPRLAKRRLSSYLRADDRHAWRDALTAAAERPVSLLVRRADLVLQCGVQSVSTPDGEPRFVLTLSEPVTDELITRTLGAAGLGSFTARTPHDFVEALRQAFAPLQLQPRIAVDDGRAAGGRLVRSPSDGEATTDAADETLLTLLRTIPAASVHAQAITLDIDSDRLGVGEESAAWSADYHRLWDDRCLVVPLPIGSEGRALLALTGPGTTWLAARQLQPFGPLLGLALERVLRDDTAQAEQARSTNLLAAYEALAAATELADVLRITCEQAARLSGGATVALLLSDAEGHTLRCAMAVGTASDRLLGQRCAPDHTLVGQVWRGEPRAIHDLSDSAEPVGLAWEPGVVRSAALVPLTREKRRLGVLALAHPQAGFFDAAQLRTLEQLGRNAAVAIEHALLHETIRRSEERYRTLFQNALEIVILLDLDGRVLSGNRAALQFLGLSPAELQAQALDISDVLPEHAAARLAELRRRALDGDVPVAVEIEIRCVDGSLALLETTVQALHEHGQPVGVYLIGRDITERRQLEAQVRQGEKLAALGQLVAGAAHELNNPLAVVLGTTQLLLHDLQAAEWIEDIRNIETAAQRAKHIVKQMLTFAREHDEVRAAIDLRLLIERGLQNVRAELQRHAIEAHVELEDTLPSMWGDAYQLEQVLDNLLHNAIHVLAVSPRMPRRISIAVAAVGKRVRLSVADNGPGIAPHVLPRIFDPFFTTKEVGAGTGLGLSLVYGIVDKHGGTVHAESILGQGATFVVELPLGRPATAEARAVVLKHASNSTILVVEDEAEVRALLERALTQHGYAVSAVSSAEAALQVLEQQPFDLVITDLRMAGLSGKELYERMRLHQPQLSWVFVTGDTMSSSSDSFLRQAGVPVLGKPFTLEELWEAVATSIVGQRQRPRAA